MSTLYRFPDGVIRWTGNAPSKKVSCMFYELDSAGLNIHEMNQTAENMELLTSAILKGATIRFPAAKKSERIARNQIRIDDGIRSERIVSLQDSNPLFNRRMTPAGEHIETAVDLFNKY